jgi:putative transposase
MMTNHFHILVKEISKGGISRFMEKLCTGYAMYFNGKYDRSGALFQGKFKAEHVNEDRYLKYLYAYIHLNPVKIVDKGWGKKALQNPNEAKKFLNEYPYSSHADYAGTGPKREERHILNKEEFPGYFAKGKEFNEYLQDWLNYQ